LPITLDRNHASCVVRLEGEIDICCAAELKQALLDALASGTGLEIDPSHATTVDITVIQLLWAAHREAGKKGVAFTFVTPTPESMNAAMREAGFEKLSAAAGPDQASQVPALSSSCKSEPA